MGFQCFQALVGVGAETERAKILTLQALASKAVQPIDHFSRILIEPI